MVASRKAITTACSGPNASTLSRHTTAIQNSLRRIWYSSRSSPTSISDNTALATIPARAALGRNANMSVKKSMTRAIVPAAITLGSWLRDPALSIAADREALLPVTSAPLKPAARLATP